jgi:peptidylprolyl isomerase
MRALMFALSLGMSIFAAQSVMAAGDWRDVDPQNLIVIETKYGRVVVELAPSFASNHAKRFQDLIRAKFYDGQSFYRVVDGFVAQGGVGEGDDKKSATWAPLKAEFDAPDPGPSPFVPLRSADLFAPEVGHVDGFPVGRAPKDRRQWILHCPGALAFARDNDPDTAGTEFYIVIGHAPRRIDRQLSAFGRVLEGMQYLQKLNRGDPAVESGVIQDPAMKDPIIRMQIAADMPEDARPQYQVMAIPSKAYADYMAKRRNPAPDFYKWVPQNLDICAINIPSRKVMPGKMEPVQ